MDSKPNGVSIWKDGWNPAESLKERFTAAVMLPSADSAFTTLEYNTLCTFSFSTVMPAVFETAELVRTFRWVKSLRAGVRIPDTPQANMGMLFAGVVMLALLWLWPKWFYPCLWISLVLILVPVNRSLGRRHFLTWLQHGDWRPVISLSLGALICGFFWEMWNFWSWPKWIYHTPGAEFLHVFEMPLLGYGGYVPFALELWALKNLLWPWRPGTQTGGLV